MRHMTIRNIPTIMPGAEPFFLTGNKIGVLCLHGVTASPDEVRWFAEHMHQQGMTVYAPRITGHGTHHDDLRHIRWQDWYLSALDGYHLLRRHCRHIYVAGLSMGGLLALLMGASEYTDGIIVMAAPLKLPAERRIRLARWIQPIRPILNLPDRTGFTERLVAEKRRRGDSPARRIRYDRWATRAVVELQRLMDVTTDILPEVTTPALLMYSQGDPTVPFDNLEILRDNIGSKHLDVTSFQRSGHILTQDYDREAVFQRATSFILRK
jgi:carboxylesterase